MKEARRTCNDRSAGLNQTSCSVCGDFKFYMKSLLRANVHISGAAYIRSPFRIFLLNQRNREREKKENWCVKCGDGSGSSGHTDPRHVNIRRASCSLAHSLSHRTEIRSYFLKVTAHLFRFKGILTLFLGFCFVRCYFLLFSTLNERCDHS